MNTRLKCLLLDDELPGLTYLKALCEQINTIQVVRAFNEPLKFIAEAKKNEFDFAIIDIEMPGMNGLDVAKALAAKPVIFATAYTEYAADAFDLDAIDYIRKPIQKERLEKAIQKVEKYFEEKIIPKQTLQVNTNKGRSALNVDQILYVTVAENDTRDKLAYLENGEQVTLKNISFDKLLGELPAGQFCQVNKKDVMATKAVQFFTHDEIVTTLKDQHSKPIRLTLSDNFKQAFLIALKK